MKRICAEAKNNIVSIWETVESMESQMPKKIKTLHLQLQIAQ